MRLHAAEVALVGVLIAGCSGEEGGTTAPPAEPSGTPSSPTAEDMALEAYEQMWGVVVEASHEGEADPPDLEVYASGDALALMRQTLEGAVEDQAEVTGEPVLDPEVVGVSPEADPNSVTILDCADGSDWMEEAETGTEDAEDPSGSRQIDATVNHDGLSWRVSELRIWEPGTC